MFYHHPSASLRLLSPERGSDTKLPKQQRWVRSLWIILRSISVVPNQLISPSIRWHLEGEGGGLSDWLVEPHLPRKRDGKCREVFLFSPNLFCFFPKSKTLPLRQHIRAEKKIVRWPSLFSMKSLISDFINRKQLGFLDNWTSEMRELQR